MTGLHGFLGHGMGVPSEGTSLLLMAAQFGGACFPAKSVAMESLARIRVSCAPHVEEKQLVAPGDASMDRASADFRKVNKKSNDALVRTLAREREFYP